MATTEVDTAETVPLTPLQKIEVEDKELLTAEYDERANQLSKDELKKIEIEITKAVTAEQLGDEDTETTQVQNDAGVRKGRVFEKMPSDPEVAEERTSAEGHVNTVDEEKDEFRAHEKLKELDHMSTVEIEVDKVDEKERDVPCVDKGEAEEPDGSQFDEQVPCAAGKTPSENVEFSDHFLDLELHKEGETQPGAKESSYDSAEEVRSVPVKHLEEVAVADDATDEREKTLDWEVKEIDISENQAEVHNEPETVPNAFYAENMKAAEGSDKLQGTKNILEDPSTSNIGNDDSETKKYVEVIVSDPEAKELTINTHTLHEGVEKVPESVEQPEERLHTQARELEAEEKETASTQVDEHISKVKAESEKHISLKDDHGVENLESSSDIIHEKIEETEPSASADKTIPDVIGESIINEHQTEENDTDFKEDTPTKEKDTAQPDLEVTENADFKNRNKEGFSSLIEETQSTESEKIDDDDASGPKTEEEKAMGSPDVKVERGNLQSMELEKPKEVDIEQASAVKDTETEKADVVQVIDEPQEVEEVHTIADLNEVDIPPVSCLTSEVNEQSYEEISKEETLPSSHLEQLLQEEENKPEKREAIIDEVNDEPLSNSIDDSITEQTNIVGQDENILTKSHGEDVTDVSLDDETDYSYKKDIREQLITKVEEEPEKCAPPNNKPEDELPESSSEPSAENPELVASDDKDGTSIATTEDLALADKIHEDHTSENKTSYTEIAREECPLTETYENTGEAETEILDNNVDMKEISSTGQNHTETKEGASDDADMLILPEEEKDNISATSKTVDSNPVENIEENDTSNLRSEKMELEIPHDIDSSPITKDVDAETNEGEKTEIFETDVTDISSLTITADDSISELPLPVESIQRGTLNNEEDDEKPEQTDKAPETVELVQLVTPAEIVEDAPGKDEDISASLRIQESIGKVEYISETDKEDHISECDIQVIAKELSIVSGENISVDHSDVAEVITENAEGKGSNKIAKESVVDDGENPAELNLSETGIEIHGTKEVPGQAEQIEEAASLDHIENKVETSLEVVSTPNDSEKLKQASEPDPDDSEDLRRTFEPDPDDSDKLQQVSEPDHDNSKIMEQISEPAPDDTETVKSLEPDQNLKNVSESDPDDSENQEKVDKKDTTEDCHDVTIKAHPEETDVDVLEKIYEQPGEAAISDELSTVSEAEDTVTHNIEVITDTDAAAEQSIVDSVYEEDSSHKIEELRTEEKSEPRQTIQESLTKSEIEHVEESGSKETVGAIQLDDAEEENKTSEASEEHIIKEVKGAEGLTPPRDMFVEESKPDEVEEEIKKEEGITNVSAKTNKDEYETPVALAEGDQTLVQEVDEQQAEDEILKHDAGKDEILQQNEPEHFPKEAEEPEPSASCLNDDGNIDLESKEVLHEKKDKDGLEGAGNVTENIWISEVLVQSHDNPGEDIELATSIVNDVKITSLKSDEEKKETQDDLEPEPVIDDEVVVQEDAQVQSDNTPNEPGFNEQSPSSLNDKDATILKQEKGPEEVQEELSLEKTDTIGDSHEVTIKEHPVYSSVEVLERTDKQPRETTVSDEVSSVSVVEEAVTRSIEVMSVTTGPELSAEDSIHEKDTSYQIPEQISEEVNDEPISTSIDDSITEQTNIVGQDENLLTKSNGEDVTDVSLDDENDDSYKKYISEQLITKVEEEPEKSVPANDKPEDELPESSLKSSAENPELVASDDKDGTSIATTEDLALADKIQQDHTSENKTSYTEIAREVECPLTETYENTGEAETEILDNNVDMKEIPSTSQNHTETKEGVSDDAGMLILPEEEKDNISATSKTVDSTPVENIEENATSNLTSEKMELEKPHDIDSSPITKDVDAETNEGEKIEIFETDVTDISSLTITADDSISELPLPVESIQKGTLNNEEDDEKPEQTDKAPETVELVQVVTPAEIEKDAPGKDEDISASLSVQESIGKVEHISETDKEDHISECDIQIIAKELPIVSGENISVDLSDVAEVITENAEGKGSNKIAEELVVEDGENPAELNLSETGIEIHGTKEVPGQAEQIEEAASLDHIENKVETSPEVVSTPNDSEKLKQVSEPDPDDSEDPKRTSEPDPDDSEKLQQVSEPDHDDSKIMEQIYEPAPDDTETVKSLEPDQNLKNVSESDPDDSENQEKVDKKDTTEDCHDAIKAHPKENRVDVLEKTYEQPGEAAISDELSTVSEADDTVTYNIEVITDTDAAAEQSIVDSVYEEDSSHKTEELRTEEKSEPRQTIQESLSKSLIEHVEESGSKETVSAIQLDDAEEENKTSEASEEHIIKEVKGAEGLTPPRDVFVEESKPDEVEEEIKKEEGITNVSADTNKDEYETPVALAEGDQTLVQEVDEQQAEDEILKHDAGKDEILQQNEPEHFPKETEEPSASSLNDDGNIDLESKEVPEQVLHEKKDKDGLEGAGNVTENIWISEVLVQSHDNPGEDIELATSIVNDVKITSLKCDEEKEQTQDDLEPEPVIDDEVVVQEDAQVQSDSTPNEPGVNEQSPSSLNDEDATILKQEKGPEEVQEELSVEKTDTIGDSHEVTIKEHPVYSSVEVLEGTDEQPRETTVSDEVSSVSVAEEAVTRSIEVMSVITGPELSAEVSIHEKDISYQIPEQISEEKSKPIHTARESITESDTEYIEEAVTVIKPNDAKEENQTSEASEQNIIKEVEGAEGLSPPADAFVKEGKPDQADKEINKEEKDKNKDEPEIPVTLVDGDQALIKGEHGEEEFLKDEEGKEAILQENESEHLLGPSASKSNYGGITDLVSRDVPEESLQEEKEKYGLEDAGKVTENIISVSEAIVQPKDNPGEKTEHLPSKPEETELATLINNDEKITALKSHEDKEEIQEKVEAEVVLEDNKERDQQKTNDNVQEKQTIDEVVMLEEEQAQTDQLVNDEPQGNEPSAIGLNDEDAIKCETGPEKVQDELSVSSQPEDNDNFIYGKIAEAVVQQDEQREAEHIGIPSDNFAALKAEEDKENEKEEEKEQDQVKENVHDMEIAVEVIIHGDQQGEQLKHFQSEDEEAELSTTGVTDEAIAIPKNSAEEVVKDNDVKEIETINEEVVQERKAVKLEYLPNDRGEAEPSDVDERITVLKTEEEPEEILHDKKMTDQVNVDNEERENVDDALKREGEQGELGHVSDETENLEPSVSYIGEEKQSSLEGEEILEKDLVEKSKNNHTEVDVDEKEIENREFVLQEPSASLGNDDVGTMQRNEEPPEQVQEQKKTTQSVAEGDSKMYESANADKIVEAESSVENTQVEDTVPRGEENTERAEEEKDQITDEKVTATELSVEEDKKGDETEHFQKMIEDTEQKQYTLSAGDDKITIVHIGEKNEESKKCSQDIEDEINEKDPSNEDSKSSFQELDAASIGNNLESKVSECVEDNAKEHSTIEDSSSSGNWENKVETSNVETEHNKSIDELAATPDETKIINWLDESIVEKDINEVVTVSEGLPIAEDKSNDEDGKGLTETETQDSDALESLPSLEVLDSEVQREIVEAAIEEEEKVASIIPVAGEEDIKDLINMETHGEKLQGAQGNEVPVPGEENQSASEFVTKNTDENNLQTLETSEVPIPAVDDETLKEILNEVPPRSPGNQEAETVCNEDQNKLSGSETLNDKTAEKTIEKESFVEADTTAGINAVEPEEISALVPAKSDEIQMEHGGDGDLPRIKDKSSLGLEDVTRATSETPITEKVPDEMAIGREVTIEQIRKEDIVIKERSVNEGKVLEPLSPGSPIPEVLNVAEESGIKEVMQMQEAKYTEVTHEVEPEEENNTKQRDDRPSDIVTELLKLQEPESIVALVGDQRTEEVTSIELNKEETKGETDTQIETPSNISEEVGANEVQFQEKITVSPADDKSEIDQFTTSEVSYEIPEEMILSTEAPQVSTREVYAGEGKQINEALAEKPLENKIEAIKETEAVKFETETKDEVIQDLNTRETKCDELEELNLDESNTNDAAIKVRLTDRDAMQFTETPSEQLKLSDLPLEKLNTNILERRESEDSKPVQHKITEGVAEGTTCRDPIVIAEKTDDTKPSSETEIQSTTGELVTPQNKFSTVQTEGSDTKLGFQQLVQSTIEAPLGENSHADKNPKDGSIPVSPEKKDVPTEIQQSTARSLDFAEAEKPQSAKKTESTIPLTIPAESLLSDLLQISTKDTIQMTQQPNQETSPTLMKEDLQTEAPKTDEDKDDEEHEEGEEHKKTDSSSDGVIVEASRDMNVKSPQKKHHGILSGVGTKVKNSISKVKKAITGKSSHPKPPSPK